MKVRCVRSFAGRAPDGSLVSHSEGEVFELPKGTDWLQAGLVVPVVERAIDQAEKEIVNPPESRTKAKKGGER
jgi:hypothetical protein